MVILGSATPSLEAYCRAKSGKYRLYELTDRQAGGKLPSVYTVDLREELKQGNRSIFSRKLHGLIAEHFIFKQAGICGVCFLPRLRVCDEMPPLRCVVIGAHGREAGLPLLRI